MKHITVDFAKEKGRMKPMHAVNNGPVYKFGEEMRTTNLEAYRAAGIPFARTHDASLCYTYGGEHIVDVANIFKNFDADATDPASYDFRMTDEYLRVIEMGGAKVFYRLGSSIEHGAVKFKTLPPKDFHKWAVICEHIIKHYCYGWADGFNMDIEYWEIWNEPDLDPDDCPDKRTWGGIRTQFYELYNITLTHLKTCFPNLKIGGPAISDLNVRVNFKGWTEGLFESFGDVKPDFLSWHLYADKVEDMRDAIRNARALLDRYGLTNCESILNEWNYLRGWFDEDWKYTLKIEKSLKGASFIASTMLMSQSEPLDMLMCYDARPSAMNSLFCTDRMYECLKGYYPFYMFNQLYKEGTQVEAMVEGDDLWASAAKGKGEQNVMIAHYNDDDNTPEASLKVTFKNVTNGGKVRLEYYILDDNHDAELVREEIFTANEFSTYINVPLYTTYLLKIVEAD